MATLQVTPSSVNFGSVVTGSSSLVQLNLVNTSPTDSITISSTSLSDSHFTIDPGIPFSPPITLGPNGSHLVRLKYTAATVETDTGNWTITCDADNNPVVVPLTGTSISGGNKSISVNPSSYNFPNTRINSNSAQVSFVVTSVGDTNVTVQVPVINGPFTGVGLPGSPTVLTPGQNFAFNVEFSPTQTGLVNQTNGIAITSDGVVSPFNVLLSGIGVLINPAYIATGGTEQGYFAVGPLLRQFQDQNFFCEEQDIFIQKLLLLSGPGFNDAILRVEIQYEDLGVASVEVVVANEYGQQASDTQVIGTAQATKAVMHALWDLKVEGELLTLSISPIGPVSIISISPRYVPGGEIKR